MIDMNVKNRLTKKIGSMAINQTMLLVLGVLVLVIIAGFYIFLGEKAEEMIINVMNFPKLD